MTPVRPAADEYDPYYAGYIDMVPDGDVLDVLTEQGNAMPEIFATVDPKQATFRYAPGKWCVNEVLGHLCDTERVFAYRALCFSRGETQPLPGMDQDDYVAGANFADRNLAEMLKELHTVRAATLSLFRSMTPDMWERRGTADGRLFTVRALAYIIAGHERHHMQVLRERYLDG